MFNHLLISLIISCWLILTAVFSIQNVTLVSLQFFAFKSISLPVGVLLSFCLAGGFFLGSLVPLFFSGKKSETKFRENQEKPKTRREYNQFKRDLEEEKDPIFDWD
jgi:uncharacterized integral membrane protein